MTEAVEIGAVTASTARALLRLRGDTASRALAELLVRRYGSLTEDQKIEFFRVLLDEFGADRAAVDAAIGNYQADPTEQTLVTLAEAADSRRLELFRAINTAPGGIAVLLDMRTVLLAQGSDVPELEPVEKDLKHLLGSWFNRGFLRLEQLTWETSAHILESLIKYEAVHEIRGWTDLRRRLAPDRRSFGFFHPALPDEPIIFVEVALTAGLATSIQDVIDAPTLALEAEPANDADTAIFYSITNCQTGLRGISFGSFLIKQVTERLAVEQPTLTTFSTLSPIPGFAAWLVENRHDRRCSDGAIVRHVSADCAPPWPASRPGCSVPSSQRRQCRTDQLAGRYVGEGNGRVTRVARELSVLWPGYCGQQRSTDTRRGSDGVEAGGRSYRPSR